MSENPLQDRSFDAEEVARILRDAAQLDTPSVDGTLRASPSNAGADGLSMAEIERAAAAVGISPAAVTAASLRRCLTAERGASEVVHVSHQFAGELTTDALERLVGELRTIASPATIRRVADGVELEVGDAGGGPGSLTMHVRSTGGVTTLSFWTRAPVLTAGDTVGWGLLGMPVVLFPVLAVSGGHWHLLGTAAVFPVGWLVGAGFGVSVNRWRTARWRERVERIVVPITMRLSELIAARDGRDASRALP